MKKLRSYLIMLAREYATVRPSVIRVNYGIQRSERGGMSTSSLALVLGIRWRRRPVPAQPAVMA